MNMMLGDTLSQLIILEEGMSARHYLERKMEELSSSGQQNAFFVADLGDVVHKHSLFLQELPRVKPFYAVKCNSTREILHTLVILGTGFGCASKGEIDMVLGMGVPPADIVYANPCKQPSHIRYAAKHGVNKITFDCESELVKVAENHPEAELILHIQSTGTVSMSHLPRKFGASMDKCKHFMDTARDLEVNIIGVSFYVGHGCKNPHVFTKSIADASMVFSIGTQAGHDMRLLDLGGGFPGDVGCDPSFPEFADVVNCALDKYFPEDSGIHIIAQPGRYYVDSAFCSAVNIITKKEMDQEGCFSSSERPVEKGASRQMMYYVNDGVYGSYLYSKLKRSILRPQTAKDIDPAQPLFPSTLWGPSCAESDELADVVDLPEMEVGDWLIFQNRGAYSISLCTNFNGFPPPNVYFVLSKEIWQLLERQWQKL